MPGQHRVKWMFHSTAMVRDYEETRDWLVRFAGLRVLHDNEVTTPGISRRGGMVWLGDNSLELGQPLDPNEASWKFVDRFGPGMHSIALQVEDIDATIDYLASQGIPPATRPMSNFIITNPRLTEGILFEWFMGEQQDDPRWGAALEPYRLPPLLNVTQYAFTGVLVAEPRQAAEHWARLFGTKITFEDPQAGPERPAAGVSTGADTTVALYRLPSPDEAARLWGSPYDRPRTHLMALRVADLAATETVLQENGVSLIRRDDGIPFPRPAQTGNIQLAFTDRLLPGDPRGA